MEQIGGKLSIGIMVGFLQICFLGFMLAYVFDIPE